MILLECLSGEQLAILAATIASLIASDLDASENNVLGAFITTVGDSISLIAAKREQEENRLEIKNKK